MDGEPLTERDLLQWFTNIQISKPITPANSGTMSLKSKTTPLRKDTEYFLTLYIFLPQYRCINNLWAKQSMAYIVELLMYFSYIDFDCCRGHHFLIRQPTVDTFTELRLIKITAIRYKIGLLPLIPKTAVWLQNNSRRKQQARLAAEISGFKPKKQIK